MNFASGFLMMTYRVSLYIKLDKLTVGFDLVMPLSSGQRRQLSTSIASTYFEVGLAGLRGWPGLAVDGVHVRAGRSIEHAGQVNFTRRKLNRVHRPWSVDCVTERETINTAASKKLRLAAGSIIYFAAAVRADDHASKVSVPSDF